MSQLTLAPVEVEAITDAADVMIRLRMALAGSPVQSPERQALAQRLEALSRAPWRPGVERLPEGVLALTPPRAWTEALIEARRLGVRG